MKRILVTGASKGIGQAVAIALAQSDRHLTLHYHRDQEGALQTQQAVIQAGGQADIIQFDIADQAQCEQVLSDYITEHGAFYGVVNNAGICKDVAFPAMETEDWTSVVHTNLDGFYNVLKPCVMPMVQLRKGGRIITIASVSGIMGNRGQVNYSASKAGIIGATKALAMELAKRKITVNCVAPGLIETDMTKNLPHQEEIMQHIPMRRAGKVEEVASLVAYLMSDSAGYLTRQVISVNGGLV